MKRNLSIVIPLFAAGLFVTPLSRAADALPQAETILDRYVEVTGGKKAYEQRHSEVSTAIMEFIGKGVKGVLTTYHAEPNRGYSVIEIEGVGKIEEGTDGHIAWERSALQGPRLKTADEKALALRGANLHSNTRWRDQFQKVETVGVESVEGQECYKVVLTPKEGKPETRFYDKKSNLLIKTQMIVKSPMGEIPSEAIAGEYRDEGGIIVPHRIRQKVLGQDFVFSVQSVKYNVDIPEARFELPDDVKALVAGPQP